MSPVFTTISGVTSLGTMTAGTPKEYSVVARDSFGNIVDNNDFVIIENNLKEVIFYKLLYKKFKKNTMDNSVVLEGDAKASMEVNTPEDAVESIDDLKSMHLKEINVMKVSIR
jgi:hypothetical protein